MAKVQIPVALGNRIIFVKNVKAKPSSYRSRAPGFLRIAPIDSGHYQPSWAERSSPPRRSRLATRGGPRSNRCVNRRAHWPSCQIILKKIAPTSTKASNCPLRGSRRSTSCTCSIQDIPPTGVEEGVDAVFRVLLHRHSSIRLAISAVHPVWWLAPMPAPLSPWKYS